MGHPVILAEVIQARRAAVAQIWELCAETITSLWPGELLACVIKIKPTVAGVATCGSHMICGFSVVWTTVFG